MDRLRTFLNPGGIFALWSNDPPRPKFLQILSGVFSWADAHVIEFENPLQQCLAANSIYLARN